MLWAQNNLRTGTTPLVLRMRTVCADCIRTLADAFALKGLNWFGFEGRSACCDGLWARPLGEHLDFVVDLGFNALRIPLAPHA